MAGWVEIPNRNNVLCLDNTDPFTPDADYEPATKKYVDDEDAIVYAAAVADIATHAALTTGVHGAGGDTLATDADISSAIAVHASIIDAHGYTPAQLLDDWLDSEHLSQDFGASSARLVNFIPEGISGLPLYVTNGAKSGFAAKINSGGSGGLTATNVPYDNDSREDMFNGLTAYDGTNYWGQIVLHNTTRGNSRKIVSVDRANNVITTTSSTDDWADNDDITTNSPTAGITRLFDMDLSAQVGSEVIALLCNAYIQDNEGAYDSARRLLFHPFESYNDGKLYSLCPLIAYSRADLFFIIPVASQKIIMSFENGCEDCYFAFRVIGRFEYADT